MFPKPINPDSKSMDEAIKDNSFWSASEADMQRWLRSVCMEPAGDSHTAKEIKELDRGNFRTQLAFAIIALIALGLSVFQIVDSRRQQEVTIAKSLITMPVSVMGGDAKADQGVNSADSPKPLKDNAPLKATPAADIPPKR